VGLEIVASGILFINPDPSRYHVFASHAHPLQLTAREFVSTYQRGSAIYAVDMELALARSRDGGVTWTDEGPIHDRGQDERPYSHHDGFLSRLRDGTLVVLTFRVDRTDPDRPMFGPTGGVSANEPVLFFSGDGGRSWSPPRPIALPTGLIGTPANPVVELADGSWLASFDRWHGFDEPGSYRPRMFALRSTDRGRTWSAPTVIADGTARGLGYWHGKTILLPDGRFYSTFWTADISDDARGPHDLPLHQLFAHPTDRHWPEPEPTPIPAQTHWPTALPDGRLCLVYTWRLAERPGFMAVLSEDGGRTWDLDHQVRLWDASGWTHIGLHAPEVYPHSHDTIAFGAPTLLTTLNGELYASWWCTYASVTHIRWARLRAMD
jgi:BNR repeat-like domain